MDKTPVSGSERAVTAQAPSSAPVGRGPGLEASRVPSLAPEQVHELLDRWFSAHPAQNVWEIPSRAGERALVFGDTHSDWPTVEMLARRAFDPGKGDGWLVGTGDYVDRAPPELPFGSAINALYLLSLQLAHPGRVVLLRGNHETQRTIPILRREVDDEASELWGGKSGLGARLEDAFDRWPLAASTESGVYLAHAGFPRKRGKGGWQAALGTGSIETLEEVVWNDLEGSSYAGGRGLDLEPITEAETISFLDEAGFSVFLRGHDPSEAGRARFQDRVLTLHSSRIYEWAGLHLVEVPLDRPVKKVADLHHEVFAAPPIPPLAPAWRAPQEK